MDAVVLVSGAAAVTPYTSADSAAGQGLAAGNTLTALRAHLLERHAAVFTAPARIGDGEVSEDTGWQGFADVPEVLPAAVTINAVGDIDAAGRKLAAFLRWLAVDHGATSVSLVAHSMGGLFCRAALRELGSDTPAVSRLITLGTPWHGALLGDVLTGEVTADDAQGDAATLRILGASPAYAAENSQGAAAEVSARYLSEWNATQTGVLDDVPVTVIGGAHFAAHSEPDRLWPHDGLVSLRSALATDVPAAVLPRVERHTVAGDVHSIFFANGLDLPWERALTWDPAVFEIVDAALTA
ncbi:PGAP1-like protein [Microbacterium sp. AG790]|uniref:lipase family alpha/beta hydrolase n=1 Tax=Microbacterium sp. AG790 TaxID=2183995 RepID=UPI000EB54CB3|nr:alpha/beta hydrolase [Microbacterium sp. AG790]RKS86788.1 PGAP1-like protein [Microbacterium sp. AG790]